MIITRLAYSPLQPYCRFVCLCLIDMLLNSYCNLKIDFALQLQTCGSLNGQCVPIKLGVGT